MKEFSYLHKVIAKLRGPGGCPWDREQTHASLKPYLLEETYETLAALDENNPALLREELGDLLLQIVLHSVIAEEKKEFSLKEVVQDIAAKMIRRHPHVFAKTKVSGVKEIWHNWEQIKKTEKKPKAEASILDSVPANLPALFRATKVQKKAARVGFDWTEIKPVIEKVREELSEFEASTAATRSEDTLGSREETIEEFGDVLFSLVNLSRKLEIDAEDALRLATKKFESRFKKIESQLQKEKKDFKDCSAQELDQYWNEAKSLK